MYLRCTAASSTESDRFYTGFSDASFWPREILPFAPTRSAEISLMSNAPVNNSAARTVHKSNGKGSTGKNAARRSERKGWQAEEERNDNHASDCSEGD